MPVSIIGTRGCGKSTLVGFLHQSMEKYTIKNPKKFAYYMDPETTDVCLNKIRNRLHAGEFPRATARGDFQALSFLMNFEATKSDVFKHIKAEKGLSGLKNAFNYENKLMFTVFDVSGEEIEEFGNHKSVTKKIKEVFNSNIMVILVDCSKLTKDIRSEKGTTMRRYDAEMSQILSRYEEYKANKTSEELHPIVFFTKMDMMDPEIIDMFPNHSMRDLLDIQKGYDEVEVREDGEKLLKTFLPGLYQNIVGSKVVGVDLHKAMYFFSWAGVDGENGVKPADQELGVKWVNVEDEELTSNIYPYKHFQKFISHLGDLSKDYSDPNEKLEEYFKREGRKML